MAKQQRVTLGAVVTLSVGLLTTVFVRAQTTGAANSSAGAGRVGKLERTPWGEPDIQGIWGVGYIFTPLERPKELAGKEFLTDAEIATLEKEHAARTSGDGTAGRPRGERGSVADVEGAYNQAFSAF